MSANRKLKPSGLPPRPLPLRLAVGLGAAVTLAHLLLIVSDPLQLGMNARPPSPAPLAFQTRRIDPAPTPTARATARKKTRTAASPSQGASVQTTEVPAPAQDITEPPAERAAPAQAEAPPEAAPELQAQAPANEPAPPPPPPAEPVAQQAQAPQLPGSARLNYELHGQSRGLRYSADGQLTWQQDGQRYEARMVISGLLLLNPRVMTSVGELGPQGVSPRRFSDKSRTERATHFQPEQGRIVFSSNAPVAVWQPGAQDQLSLFFQLAGLLAADPDRFANGTQVQVLTAGTREAEPWTFTVVGRATLTLPAGEQATVELKREPRRPYDQTIDLWFAPALGYLPVRIRITQANGDVVDQLLASVQPL